MEQLINAATIPYYASAILLALGAILLGTLGIIVLITSIVEGKEDVKKRIKLIIALFIIGMPLLASGFYCKDIYDKCNNQAKSIVKNIIAKEYPDATKFEFDLFDLNDESCTKMSQGSFTENGMKYKIEYQKTISDEEKLIVTVKGGQSKNKDVKTFNIPKKQNNKNQRRKSNGTVD